METMKIGMPQSWQDAMNLQKRPLKKVEIDIPDYAPSHGVIPVGSDKDAILDVQIEGQDQQVIITADKEGLIVLARHLLTLAQDAVPSGAHIHYDDDASTGLLERGSHSMMINKISSWNAIMEDEEEHIRK